jgi:hypothetical protein
MMMSRVDVSYEEPVYLIPDEDDFVMNFYAEESDEDDFVMKFYAEESDEDDFVMKFYAEESDKDDFVMKFYEEEQEIDSVSEFYWSKEAISLVSDLAFSVAVNVGCAALVPGGSALIKAGTSTAAHIASGITYEAIKERALGIPGVPRTRTQAYWRMIKPVAIMAASTGAAQIIMAGATGGASIPMSLATSLATNKAMSMLLGPFGAKLHAYAKGMLDKIPLVKEKLPMWATMMKYMKRDVPQEGEAAFSDVFVAISAQIATGMLIGGFSDAMSLMRPVTVAAPTPVMGPVYAPTTPAISPTPMTFTEGMSPGITSVAPSAISALSGEFVNAPGFSPNPFAAGEQVACVLGGVTEGLTITGDATIQLTDGGILSDKVDFSDLFSTTSGPKLVSDSLESKLGDALKKNMPALKDYGDVKMSPMLEYVHALFEAPFASLVDGAAYFLAGPWYKAVGTAVKLGQFMFHAEIKREEGTLGDIGLRDVASEIKDAIPVVNMIPGPDQSHVMAKFLPAMSSLMDNVGDLLKIDSEALDDMRTSTRLAGQAYSVVDAGWRQLPVGSEGTSADWTFNDLMLRTGLNMATRIREGGVGVDQVLDEAAVHITRGLLQGEGYDPDKISPVAAVYTAALTTATKTLAIGVLKSVQDAVKTV